MLNQEIWAELYANRKKIKELKADKEALLAQVYNFLTEPETSYSSPNLLETLPLEKRTEEDRKRKYSFKTTILAILVFLKLKEKNND